MQQVPNLFLKGILPPGCNFGPKLCLVLSHRESLTRFYCSKINMPIRSELKSHTSHHGQKFAMLLSLFFFFCSFPITPFFSPCQRESLAFGISFHGSSFYFFRVDVGRRMQKSTGGIAKGRDRVGEIKVCHINSALCESAYQHRESSEDILPDTSKCHQNSGIIHSVIYF